jgi:hypothetical protein
MYLDNKKIARGESGNLDAGAPAVGSLTLINLAAACLLSRGQRS